MIIGIHGSIGEGKDTVANMIIDRLPEFQNKKFAYKLKQIASVLCGVDVDKFEDNDFKDQTMPIQYWSHPITGEPITYRFLLMYMGTELFRDHFNKNFWVNALLSDYTDDDKYLITDLRFKTELDAILNRGGLTILVKRYAKISEWIESSYFQNVIKNSYVNHYKQLDLVICKQDFVSYLINEIDAVNVDSSNWKKLIHSSEREIHQEEFDIVIKNKGTLDDLKNAVNLVVDDLVNKFVNKN